MLSSSNSARRGSTTLSSSNIPPLPLFLPLEQITLGKQKYTRSGELRRVLGIPFGNTLEDHSFGVGHSKPTPPLATEELKNIKDSVQDTSRKAGDRAKLFRGYIFKLDRYEEARSSTKQQMTDLLSNERLGRANMLQMGGQISCNPLDHPPEKLENKTKGNDPGMKKRIRTSMLDSRADGRSADVPRQQIVVGKGRDILKSGGGDAIRIEEKIPRMPAGGGGWDKKMKRKRSIGALGNRTISGDRDMKRAIHSKPSADTKLQPIEAQGSRTW